MKVLIFGVNGFVGHHLSRTILEHTSWEVHGMDLSRSRLDACRRYRRFHFLKGDIARDRGAVRSAIRRCDVVLPLVAIATPKLYVTDPLKVYELDFEANLPIVRHCLAYRKRLIFPSSSEVYGMCGDRRFDEETSRLVLGPIQKDRWIYSCAKQMLDRVIWAYGHRRGLDFTIIRPFNWIGPRLDSLDAAKEGSSRVVTQFIADLYLGRPMLLVDGGRQRRSFTDIDDGIDALMRIIRNPRGRCTGRIFNIGNPRNECSIAELALRLRRIFRRDPRRRSDRRLPPVRRVSSRRFYGRGYQDILSRTPSIRLARRLLGWSPKVPLDRALKRTVTAFLDEHDGPSHPADRRDS